MWRLALVAQRIEHRPPEPCAQVRVLPRALLTEVFRSSTPAYVESNTCSFQRIASLTVTHAFQASLLALGEPTLTELGPTVERTHLSDGAWVDSRPSWVDGADELFERLRSTIPWRAEQRPMYDRTVDVPRLVAMYGTDDPLPSPLVQHARTALSEHYSAELGEPFRTVGCCLYRDGDDSVAWHGDRFGRGRRDDTMVAIIVLGARRRFGLRPRATTGRTLWFKPGHGDLLVMGGSCQRTWEHAVPKSSRPTGPRLSLQFRPRNVF